MDTRLANTWRITVNEKKFIETALDSNLRVDGRNPLEFRNINIKFGREDGSSDVQLGKTRVMGFVTAQLVQPYRDRPNEGSLSIYTEFSPMADPSFEAGRPGESAVELGRLVDRGLRDSRAVDTESLCVLPGKLVWAIRIDLHIIDNGGNLVDAANIAALAALLTFRRPECTLGGHDGQEVIIHPPEVREPLALVVHHLPIAVTFAFFGSEGKMVVDPTYSEEAVLGARMTVTANANGDICAIQKAGGEGVPHSVILHCLHLASLNAESITKKIKSAVEVHNTERALRKIKRQSVSVANVSVADGDTRNYKKASTEKGDEELSRHHSERLKLVSEAASVSQNNDIDSAIESSNQAGTSGGAGDAKNFSGGLSSWDPHSKGVDSDFVKATVASHGPLTCNGEQTGSDKSCTETEHQKLPEDAKPSTSVIDPSETALPASEEKTSMHAVKAKNKRRKKSSSNRNES